MQKKVKCWAEKQAWALKTQGSTTVSSIDESTLRLQIAIASAWLLTAICRPQLSKPGPEV